MRWLSNAKNMGADNPEASSRRPAIVTSIIVSTSVLSSVTQERGRYEFTYLADGTPEKTIVDPLTHRRTGSPLLQFIGVWTLRVLHYTDWHPAQIAKFGTVGHGRARNHASFNELPVAVSMLPERRLAVSPAFGCTARLGNST